MKHTILIFLFLPFLLTGQTIVSDTAYVRDTVIEGAMYYQEVRSIQYDNGASQTSTGELLDSTEFVRRAFRDAHDAMLPIAEAVRILSNPEVASIRPGVPAGRRTHQYYSDILEQVTGQDYTTGVLKGGNFTNYIQGYGNAVWRVFYDSLGTQRDFFVYYNDSLNVGREITNAAECIAGDPPAYKPNPTDRRIRFFPYERFFARLTVLVRSGAALTPLFTPLVEVRESVAVVDDDGLDTGRRVWYSVNQTGLVPPVRLVKIPIKTP